MKSPEQMFEEWMEKQPYEEVSPRYAFLAGFAAGKGSTIERVKGKVLEEQEKYRHRDDIGASFTRSALGDVLDILKNDLKEDILIDALEKTDKQVGGALRALGGDLKENV